jgi:CrcB protein
MPFPAMPFPARSSRAAAPIDPDVDLHVPAQRRQRAWDPAVLGAIAVGGVLGAEARYGMSVWLPHQPGQWPGATWLVNTSGCFLIGVLMTVITELAPVHRLIRPFLGVGILGGYTTFSTAMVDVQQMAVAGREAQALGYLAATVAAALAATFLGATLARTPAAAWAGRRRRRNLTHDH